MNKYKNKDNTLYTILDSPGYGGLSLALTAAQKQLQESKCTTLVVVGCVARTGKVHKGWKALKRALYDIRPHGKDWVQWRDSEYVQLIAKCDTQSVSSELLDLLDNIE